MAPRYLSCLLLACALQLPAHAALRSHSRTGAHGHGARAAAAPAPPVSAGQTEAQLRALRERIERVSQEVGRDTLASDRLAASLRNAELEVAAARRALAQLISAEAAHAQRRAQLAAQRDAQRAALAHQRGALAQQLRVAYLIERHDPLQRLLNQDDPAQARRMLTWYGYFSRARAERISAVRQQMQAIDALDAALAEQAAALAQVAREKAQQLQQLDAASGQRRQALASLQNEARTHAASLARLQAQQASLERLLRELGQAVRPSAAPPGPVPPGPAPPDTHSAFGRLRGQLEWPVAGRVQASYGEARAGGVKWQGTVVGTTTGAPVHAVAAGRVIYADWLPGLGLLAIVDHGAGYLSLYGYNGELRAAAGAAVVAGEIIATAGDTGGRPAPQLYFEIRRAGQPLDPRPWFRRRAPE